jgi:NPCBM/NEW2 domain
MTADDQTRLGTAVFMGQKSRAGRAIQMQENSPTKTTEPASATTRPASSKPTAMTTLTRGAGVVGGLIGAFFALVALATPVLKIAGLVACVCVGWAMLQVAHERDRGRLANSLLIWLSASGASTLLLIILLAGQSSGLSAPDHARDNPAAASSSVTPPPSTSSGSAETTTTITASPTVSSRAATSSVAPSSAAGPAVTWLTDLQPRVGSVEHWMTKPVQVKGVTYNRAVSAAGSWCFGSDAVYELSGQYRRFKAMVSLADNSPGTRPLNFYVLADGITVAKITDVGVASPQPVELSVAGVDLLSIRMEPSPNDYSSCPGPDRIGVWIDPSLTM